MTLNEIFKAFDNLCFPDKPLIWVATSDEGEPHLVPVCFIKALDESQILIGNVFIKETEGNLKSNPRIAVGVAFNKEGWDGYMIKGTGKILTKGKPFMDFRKEVLERSKEKRVLQSAILVTVGEIYSLKPKHGTKRLA
jgi:predicted pyridoxine 5'-phosphate oxidase superfamily flavin-nucleotide-binding protein